MSRNLIQFIKPVVRGSGRRKHRNRVTLRDTPIAGNGDGRNRATNRNKATNLNDKGTPNVSHNRRETNTKKTSNSKRKRNTIEKLLSINGHAGKRTLVHTNLFDKHTNTKESSLRRPFRDTPNGMTMQVKHSMLRKTHKGFAEKSVRNRSNRKGTKILKGKTTLLLRNENNLNIEPRIRKATRLKNGVAEPAKGLTTLNRDKFVVRHIRAFQTGSTGRASSGDNGLNFTIEVVPKKSLRENVGTNGAPVRKGVGLTEVVQLSIVGVSSVLQLGSTHSTIGDRTMRNFNRKGKGKSGPLKPT